ncbi:uncharacterized protein LOC105226966 [Bactrocera dorsalis]|uniref:Uncharacterized protein LOC105226966 n=1 Tax=Bactrocera dorsalis TaxID=27457 RepID=A0A9B2GYR4_BACDO|nr:uncharacterized protein LOC105226966 [Bactrocera dorsalis]
MIDLSRKCFIVLICITSALAVDLQYSEIVTVNNETRYIVLNPDAALTLFNKNHYVGGQYVFTSGKRITGDRLILNFQDSTQFTKGEDVEALLRYPAKGTDTNIITQVDIYAAVSSEDADSFFVDGGINKSFCEILIAGNKTSYVEFEMFIYGY